MNGISPTFGFTLPTAKPAAHATSQAIKFGRRPYEPEDRFGRVSEVDFDRLPEHEGVDEEGGYDEEGDYEPEYASSRTMPKTVVWVAAAAMALGGAAGVAHALGINGPSDVLAKIKGDSSSSSAPIIPGGGDSASPTPSSTPSAEETTKAPDPSASASSKAPSSSNPSKSVEASVQPPFTTGSANQNEIDAVAFLIQTVSKKDGKAPADTLLDATDIKKLAASAKAEYKAPLKAIADNMKVLSLRFGQHYGTQYELTPTGLKALQKQLQDGKTIAELAKAGSSVSA